MTRPDLAGTVVDQADEWHRLSPWMIAVRPVEQLPQLIPVLLAIVFAGRSAPLLMLSLAIVAVLVVAVVPWLTTRYQVTDEHVRVRSGLLTRKVATARRDRVRSVDLTASLPLRLLGLQKVRIGTGGDKQSSVVELNAVGAPEAQMLHEYLMATGARESAQATAQSTPAGAPQQLSHLQPSWLRFAPFSMAGLAAAAAVGGLSVQLANETGLYERGASIAEKTADSLRAIPLPLLVTAVVVAVLVVGAVLSVAGYVLGYWNFDLSRNSDDATLRIRRGLLTTNATSLDEARVRGVHLHEPILMRPLGGSRLHAIATGPAKTPLLLPPAPAEEAVRVGRLVTHEGDELTVPLIRHGAVALSRRLTRAFWGGALVAIGVIVAVIGPLTWPWLVVAGAAAIGTTGLGVVRYRHLGFRITERSVVVGPPRVARHRYVVDRDGVVGWASRASFFQRRRGVETLVLATAAGTEAYAMVDVDPAAATEAMATVSPDLVAPFLI
ncbi:PH domain-containing protein [Gordonia sp. HNM0687]|uniref:PH domain-containing protein n=1 Tax=Gordonia mangrovi TaxID=2665643 RepID=A0A6L7GL54_9ACTN|nr:PH domain-containing protein [Gordonia mangrovi]MXP20634.1 PH domain-containing protein [Gordonia mangrovi]UVF78785.1 PH domain-containing protein [Gordonia mangrovi]